MPVRSEADRHRVANQRFTPATSFDEATTADYDAIIGAHRVPRYRDEPNTEPRRLTDGRGRGVRNDYIFGHLQNEARSL